MWLAAAPHVRNMTQSAQRCRPGPGRPPRPRKSTPSAFSPGTRPAGSAGRPRAPTARPTHQRHGRWGHGPSDCDLCIAGTWQDGKRHLVIQGGQRCRGGGRHVAHLGAARGGRRTALPDPRHVSWRPPPLSPLTGNAAGAAWEASGTPGRPRGAVTGGGGGRGGGGWRRRWPPCVTPPRRLPARRRRREKQASDLLKAHGWKVERAADAFFESGGAATTATVVKGGKGGAAAAPAGGAGGGKLDAEWARLADPADAERMNMPQIEAFAGEDPWWTGAGG
jgi:hypothetical protein